MSSSSGTSSESWEPTDSDPGTVALSDRPLIRHAMGGLNARNRARDRPFRAVLGAPTVRGTHHCVALADTSSSQCNSALSDDADGPTPAAQAAFTVVRAGGSGLAAIVSGSPRGEVVCRRR